MYDEIDFDFDDYESSNESAALVGAAVVGGTIGAVGGAYGGHAIVGGIQKSRHKKETKNDGDISDADWKIFEKGIKIAQKSASGNLRKAILQGNPNIQRGANNKEEKYVSDWMKYFIVIGNYDQNKVRQQHMCPLIKIKDAAFSTTNANMISIVRTLRNLINDDLDKSKNPCRVIETEWGGCSLGVQFKRKGSSAKESVGYIPEEYVRDTEEYFNDIDLTYIAFESAMLEYDIISGIDVYDFSNEEEIGATESTGDFLFGGDLFETTIAYETIPANEGVGSAIVNGIRTVLSAIKNFFIKIANGIKSIGQKKPESSQASNIKSQQTNTTNNSQPSKSENNNSNAAKTNNASQTQAPAKKSASAVSQSSVNTIVSQMRSIVGIINSEISTSAAKCRQVQQKINNALNKALSGVNRMTGANEKNLEKVGSQYSQMSGDNSGAADKELENAQSLAKSAQQSSARVGDAMQKLQQAFGSAAGPADVDKAYLKTLIMRNFDASTVSNVRGLCDQIIKISGDNVKFCDSAINKYGNSANMKNSDAQRGYQMCKTYLAISSAFSGIAHHLTRLCTGSVFSSQK